MEKNDENIIRHLEALQNIITRMAQNSFKVKGWCITLVSAILGIFISNSVENYKYYGVLLVPIVGFGILDTFYLRLERIFRTKYNDTVKKINENKIDEIKLFSFSNSEEKLEIKPIKVLISSSILLTYIPLILIVIFILFIVK